MEMSCHHWFFLFHIVIKLLICDQVKWIWSFIIRAESAYILKFIFFFYKYMIAFINLTFNLLEFPSELINLYIQFLFSNHSADF
jgi:hypothetical protein